MKSITLLAILTLASFHQSLLPASAADQEAGDKETLFNNAKAFVDAFEKGDAKAVAAFWAEDGYYVDLTGRRLQGRPAIEDAFKDFNGIDPAIARGLQRAVKEVPIKLQEGVTKMKTVNGWIRPSDLGRYGTDYDTRAGIAYVGLGADMPEDTIYPTAFVDGDGKPLDSANKYVMHYEKGQLPPNNATWSVSQYQGNFYVPNTLNRYAIAPWMPLKFNVDGSLDIYLQAESPGPDKEANWLPTPPGPFNITIRNYWPKEEALNGSYKNPPIKKIQ